MFHADDKQSRRLIRAPIRTIARVRLHPVTIGNYVAPMDLILWRHADAVPVKNDSEADFQRRLTSKGQKQAARVAEWLERHLPDSTKVLVSPSVRARETAEALDRKIQIVPELLPGATAAHVLIAAGWPDSKHPVLVIGHQPTLGQVASLLLFGEEQYLSIRKASVWWITDRAREDDETRLMRHTRVSLRAAVCPDYL
jgi:phosphohistidine phosphatase